MGLMLIGQSLTADADIIATSPDGKIALDFIMKEGRPVYQVSYGNQVIIKESALGLITNIEDLSKDLQLSDIQKRSINEEYDLRSIKQSHVSYQDNEAKALLIKNGRHVMDITFRVSNRDVAFNYTLLPVRQRRDERLSCIIQQEVTSFQLSTDATGFLAPQSNPMTGFARTAPSYETTYGIDQPIGKNGWGNGYTFPCLFKTNNLWALISETGTDGNYVGCRLIGEPDGRYHI